MQLLSSTLQSSSVPAQKASVDITTALSGLISTQFQEASAFLKELGLDNPAEIARIVDIATNPQSIFVTFQDRKRSYNASARPLTVKDDMKPVVEYLREQGLQTRQVVAVVKGHPPILSYSIGGRIAPLFDYLRSVGFDDPAEIVAARPSLIGLDVESNVKRIVEYLRSREYPEGDIIAYLKSSV